MVSEISWEKGVWWQRGVNFVRRAVTMIVVIILLATTSREGAWAVVLAIPLLIFLFRAIKKHYETVAEALSTREIAAESLSDIADVVIIPIADVHRGTLRALKYAQRISRDVRAICIITNPEQRERLQRRWDRFPEITGSLTLVCLDYEYRDIITPLENYIDQVNNQEFPDQLVTVIVPEFVPKSFGEQLLHNQTANFLRFRLRGQEDIVVIDLPFHV